MSKSAPLPGSEARLNPDLVGQRRLDGRMQAALYHARERRLERFVRRGLSNAEADDKLERNLGGSFHDVLTGTQGQEIVTLIAPIESSTGFPNGTMVDTGSLGAGQGHSTVLESQGTGTIQLIVTTGGTTFINTGFVDTSPLVNISSGLHFYTIAIDPTIGRYVVHVDGRGPVIDVTNASNNIWGSTGLSWRYAPSSLLGNVFPLEVYLNRLPALF